MIFDAKCQSFKMIAVVFGLIGATFVTDCRAERTPVTPVKRDLCLDLLGHEDAGQMKAAQQSLQHNEKKWTEFKLFASEKAAMFNQKFASLKLNEWWKRQGVTNRAPSEKQLVIKETDSVAIAPTTMLLRLATNLTLVQYWQVSEQTAGLIRTGRQYFSQASLKLQDDFQSSLVKLIESTATNFNSIANASKIVTLVAGGSSFDSGQMNTTTITAVENVDADASSDPYWGYYSDCDYWGAKINYSDED